MSKSGKSLKNNQRIILSKLENTFCGDKDRLCSKKILDGYNARLRASEIRINIYDFYIKQGNGYKLRKNYKILLNKKFNKKNPKKSLKDAKEIQQKMIEIDNETKKKVELLQKELQENFRESLRKEQEEQEYADRLRRRLEVLNPNKMSGKVINSEEVLNPNKISGTVINSEEVLNPNKMSGKVINSEEEVNKILKRKNNNTNMLKSKTMKPTEIKKISKDINIPYKKIALALGLTGLGGGLIYMNTRKGNKKTKKNKKRKFGTKLMTLDRYKDQVKNTIKKYVDKNKKVKDYSLKVRGCFKEQHLKGKNLANFLKYYKGQQIYAKQINIAIDEYTEKRLKLFNDKYKKMQKLYNNLQYTTRENRLDIISITQHPALTTEEKNFIIKKINKTENYYENMFGHFKRIVEVLYFRNNNPEILYNKERLDEIMNDVYKKDINEQYVQNFLKKEMEKNGLFMDKDGILKMKKNSPIMKKIRKDFRKFLYEQKLNKFNKLGRLQDFSNIDLSGIRLEYGIFSNCNFKGAILKGASLRFCNLEGANLEGANLEGADLKGANLIKAKLNKANLEEARLKGAELKEAELKEANLQGAILKGTNLEEANLQGADLRGTDLRNCSVIFKIRYFKGAKINKQTSFPNQYIGQAVMSSMDFYDENDKKVSKNEPAKFKSVFASSAAKKYWEAKGQPMENLFVTTPSHTKGYTLNDVKKALGERQERLGLSETPLFPWASRSSNNNTQYDTSLQPDDSDLWVYGNDR